MVVANPALHRVGGGGGDRARRVIGGVHAVGVQAQLIVPALAVSGEGYRQILGLAVAAGKREADIRSALPSFQQAGMQRLVVRRLLRFAAQLGDGRLGLVTVPALAVATARCPP